MMITTNLRRNTRIKIKLRRDRNFGEYGTEGEEEEDIDEQKE